MKSSLPLPIHYVFFKKLENNYSRIIKDKRMWKCLTPLQWFRNLLTWKLVVSIHVFVSVIFSARTELISDGRNPMRSFPCIRSVMFRWSAYPALLILQISWIHVCLGWRMIVIGWLLPWKYRTQWYWYLRRQVSPALRISSIRQKQGLQR